MKRLGGCFVFEKVANGDRKTTVGHTHHRQPRDGG